jgi:hypothetical protein
MEAGTSAYMLLFRGTDWHKGLSPEQMQQIGIEWKNWFERLAAEGLAISGNPLEARGRIVSGKSGTVSADGPFAESKEAIGGYFMLNVADMDQAVAIAQQCPGLAYGAVVEVRPVAAACALGCSGDQSPAQEQLAHAKA